MRQKQTPTFHDVQSSERLISFVFSRKIKIDGDSVVPLNRIRSPTEIM